MQTQQWPSFPPSEQERELSKQERELSQELGRLTADLRDFQSREQAALNRGWSTVGSWAEKIVTAERRAEEVRTELELVRAQTGPLERARGVERYVRFSQLAREAVEATFAGQDRYQLEEITEPLKDADSLVYRFWQVASGFEEAPTIRIRHNGDLDFELNLMDRNGKHIFAFDARVNAPRERFETYDTATRQPVYRREPAYPNWGSSSMSSPRQARAKLHVYEAAMALCLTINLMFGIDPEGPITD